MKSLNKSFQQLRGTLGLRTLIEDSIPRDHASNGWVERAIQTVRRQGNALLEDLRKRTKLALHHNHPVFGWATRHSAWCLNRFHKHSATGHTPHEMVKGKSFTGMLAAFGECIIICRPQIHAGKVIAYGKLVVS